MKRVMMKDMLTHLLTSGLGAVTEPGQVKVTNSWHLLWTTKLQTWHWNPCLPMPQMKSVQWLQKVGCLKKRAVNWWSFTSTILLCFSAPLLWKTGTLGGGERGEGRGEAPEEVVDAGEASVSGEREGEGETGVDMMPVDCAVTIVTPRSEKYNEELCFIKSIIYKLC